MIMPAHCKIVNCSLYISTAPISVQNGLVALIGVTIVIGRFFNAKYARIHEVPTMTALAKKCRCASSVCGGMNQIFEEAYSGARIDVVRLGKKMREPLKVAKKSTGMTALLFKDHFFATS